jgi:hypothetical protein
VNVTAAAPAWRVHLPTADTTCVTLLCARRGDADPWPLARPLAELMALGAVRDDRPHAVGAGRGIPIMHRQALHLDGIDIELASVRGLAGDDEVTLSLPPWDELIAAAADEDAVWEIVDIVAAGCGGRVGSIGDGEAMTLAEAGETLDADALLRRHVGVLLQDLERTPAATHVYRLLPRSGLAVILR